MLYLLIVFCSTAFFYLPYYLYQYLVFLFIFSKYNTRIFSVSINVMVPLSAWNPWKLGNLRKKLKPWMLLKIDINWHGSLGVIECACFCSVLENEVDWKPFGYFYLTLVNKLCCVCWLCLKLCHAGNLSDFGLKCSSCERILKLRLYVCVLLSDDPQYNRRVLDDTVVLHNVTPEDSAVYQCAASNSHGSLLANINIMVISEYYSNTWADIGMEDIVITF